METFGLPSHSCVCFHQPSFASDCRREFFITNGHARQKPRRCCQCNLVERNYQPRACGKLIAGFDFNCRQVFRHVGVLLLRLRIPVCSCLRILCRARIQRLFCRRYLRQRVFVFPSESSWLPWAKYCRVYMRSRVCSCHGCDVAVLIQVKHRTVSSARVIVKHVCGLVAHFGLKHFLQLPHSRRHPAASHF